jgi:hypothetical protein
MSKHNDHFIENENKMKRRDFLKIGGLAAGVAASGIILGNPDILAQEKPNTAQAGRPKTNIDDVLKIPKTKNSLPGAFPGRVVEIHNEEAIVEDKIFAETVSKMFEDGITKLTGKNMKDSFALFFDKNDIVGIKVNPVGGRLLSPHHELVDDIINWLTTNGIKKENIIIWDRVDFLLKEAGYTQDRFPGVGIESLQTIAFDVIMGKSQDNNKWLDKEGKHLSVNNFDMNNYYWVDVDGEKDLPYLHQNVVNDKYSYFGKLVTQKLTKIINIPVFKSMGNGISMASKNLGYGAICNTARLHKPLMFDVCTEVLAFPAIRDKLVLNITDGLKGQYNGGPDANSKFIYTYNTLFFASDPFASDTICHNVLIEKRKGMNIKVNEHPMFTDYLRYAQKLGLGITDIKNIEHIKA